MAAGTDLTLNMVANDRNVAATFDILADGLGEIADVMRRTAQRLRDVRIEEEGI